MKSLFAVACALLLLDAANAAQQCPANSYSRGNDKCQCNPGFDVSSDGTACVKAANAGPFNPSHNNPIMYTCTSPF